MLEKTISTLSATKKLKYSNSLLLLAMLLKGEGQHFCGIDIQLKKLCTHNVFAINCMQLKIKYIRTQHGLQRHLSPSLTLVNMATSSEISNW